VFQSQTDTEGKGGNTLSAVSDDPLGSQNPIIVAGKCLLAVSSGSNEITSFEIKSETSIRRENKVDSEGRTPVSLTEYDGIVYVLNAEDGGSIHGFDLDPTSCKLSSIIGSTLPLDQSPVVDSPVPDPPLSVTLPPVIAAPTQISFTPNGRSLIVAIKGIRGHAVVFGGSIVQFEVNTLTGLASPNPTSNLIGLDSVLPFSFDFDGEGNLLLVDAFGEGPIVGGDGASVISYKVRNPGPNREISRIDRITLEGQFAAGWIKYNDDCAYTTNSGTHSVSGLSVHNGQLSDSFVASLGTDTLLNNPLDLNFSHDGFLYVLSTNSGQGAPADPPVGEPAIHVYERTNRNDCTLTEIQVINDGIPTEGQNAGATAARNGEGTVGIAVY